MVELTKAVLLATIRDERGRLERKLAGLTPDEMVRPGCMGDWSVKDILAHLVDWEQRLVGWYEAGRRGETPAIPAPGRTWQDLAALNQAGLERHRGRPLDDVLADFAASHGQVLALIRAMSDAEIFTAGRYAWTGKSSLQHWIEANTADHYRWAWTQIRPEKIRQGGGSHRP